MVGTTDSWVVKSDGIGSCALTQTLASSIFGFPFTAERQPGVLDGQLRRRHRFG